MNLIKFFKVEGLDVVDRFQSGRLQGLSSHVVIGPMAIFIRF